MTNSGAPDGGCSLCTGVSLVSCAFGSHNLILMKESDVFPLTPVGTGQRGGENSMSSLSFSE